MALTDEEYLLDMELLDVLSNSSISECDEDLLLGDENKLPVQLSTPPEKQSLPINDSSTVQGKASPPCVQVPKRKQENSKISSPRKVIKLSLTGKYRHVGSLRPNSTTKPQKTRVLSPKVQRFKTEPSMLLETKPDKPHKPHMELNSAPITQPQHKRLAQTIHVPGSLPGHVTSLQTTPTTLPGHVTSLQTTFGSLQGPMSSAQTTPRLLPGHMTLAQTTPTTLPSHMTSVQTTPRIVPNHMTSAKTTPITSKCHISGQETLTGHMTSVQTTSIASPCHVTFSSSIKTSPNKSSLFGKRRGEFGAAGTGFSLVHLHPQINKFSLTHLKKMN